MIFDENALQQVGVKYSQKFKSSKLILSYFFSVGITATVHAYAVLYTLILPLPLTLYDNGLTSESLLLGC